MRILLLLCLALPALGAHVQQHIIGGGAAIIANYAYQMSLRENGLHTCGAALISTTRAVTTGQCAGSPIGVYSILGGTSDRTDTNCATCVLRNLNLILIHPDFALNGGRAQNDIAVLGFTEITFNNNLAAVTLATNAGGDLAGTICAISGWGETRSGGNLETNLQRADMTVLTNTVCEDTWGHDDITDGQICTYETGITGCTGDRGGPLVCGGDTLAGLIAWGDPACSPSYPLVHTRISSFYAWIIAQ